MSSTWNRTSWTWKLWGVPPRFVTSQISVVPDRRVDATHVHVEPVDDELPRRRRILRGEPGHVGQLLRHRGRGSQPGGGAQLEDVEDVVPAGEAAIPWIGAQVRWVTAQDGAFAGAQGDDDLRAFPRRQLDPARPVGPRQQPAVGSDEVEDAVVGETEVVDARGRRVEQPQPDPLRGHLLVGRPGPVDQDLVSEPPGAGEHRQAVIEPAVGGEPLLHDHWDVVHAVRAGQVEGPRRRVVDEEQTGGPQYT